MLNFLFLLLLIRIAELDWRTKSFNFTILLPLILLIILFHPYNIILLICYLLLLSVNNWTKELYIGSGDVDILWIGFCLTNVTQWYEWLLSACLCHYLITKCMPNDDKIAPFVPALATSWLLICIL